MSGNRPSLPRLLLLAACLAFFLPQVRAAEILERRISVDFQDILLKNALEEIARQGEFQWSYNAGILPKGKIVTLRASNWTVRETLYALLGEGYEFKSSGNYLILKKRRQPADELSGYVTDPQTGQRLANATVYDRRTLRATTTDENGYYRLKKTGRKAEVVVSKLGYRDTVLQIASNTPRFQKIDLSTYTPAHPTTDKSPFWETAYTQTERFFSATLDRWNAINVPDSLHRRFQVSFLPYLGTNHSLSGQVENDYSLNILAGHSRRVRMLEIGGLANFTHESVDGVQIGGLFNSVRGDVRGVQVGGLVNLTRDTLMGLQIAGLVNRSRINSEQAIQVAGLVNTAHSGKSALQVAGLVNTADTLQGVQISGLVNHARSARGVQIGLFNSARELNGLQIGLLNRHGRRWMPLFNW